MDISVSVDGFVTGPDLHTWPGLGKGGERLHAWLDHEEGRRLSDATFAASGAVVTSRRVYDDTDGWAAEDGFFRRPVLVVTHRPHPVVRKGDTTFTFVTGGVAAALSAAAAVAGPQRVHVMGGASIARQALLTGLVDHLRLHIAPVLLGAGTALFDGAARALEWLETVDTPGATHVTYRVGRP
ncbi:dihydrofolate reductase family protein [Dactylosporangium aurantiacum]|uniref:dihydrofolate reductase family protein n=1 Tax=Dactylosporangium aurantiacum TaxID=35754 RepID=UPI0006948E46|nr:dihydrofolate reductase family protein [Dactylosporangium aurantiacum]MDG6103319.1 dihydrofolate reductase family protein [Dactylosporangium aurantiacum]